MNSFKNEIKSNFTATPNIIPNDERLSWKAKGIFLYLASKPDDWQFYMNEIKKNATDGKTSLQTGIKELEEFGYLIRKKSVNDEGKFDGWDWTLTIPDEQINRQTENPLVGKHDSRETPSYTNTNSTNKELTNTDNNTTVTALADDVPSASDSVTWNSSIRIAEHLLDAICEWDDTHRYNTNRPSIKSWVKDIDLAIRRDGRTEDQMIYIIDAVFVNNHKFKELWDKWPMNIQSGGKLRDKFDDIKNQIKTSSNGRTTADYGSKLADTKEFLNEYYSKAD